MAEFVSPTHGRVSFERMMELVLDYMHADQQSSYKLMVGTDSQNGRDKTAFVTVVMVHRTGEDGTGRGAIFFYTREIERRLRAPDGKLEAARIFSEAARSLELMSTIANLLKATNEAADLEVHLDVGMAGETKKLVKDVVGMITGAGFVAKIKPDAPAASHTADAFTKAPVAAAHRERLFRKERRYAKGG